MCSSTRGPAMAPSLVTWPTRNSTHPDSLAKRISRAAASRTWDTEPGAEAMSGRYMVWMESTTHTWGSSWSSRWATTSMSFSGST